MEKSKKLGFQMVNSFILHENPRKHKRENERVGEMEILCYTIDKRSQTSEADMSKTRKKKRKTQPGQAQGLAAISLAVAALALVLFLLTPKPGGEPDPTEPPTETTEPPIPLSVYGPEDFEFGEDGYLRCTAGNAVLGIDVSDHQQEVDWQQVADAGMEFAMVRIGYRGYTSGGLYEDERARENLLGAEAAGLKVGAYFFSQATTITEAALEAAWCIDFLEDFDISMPVVYDWEYVSEDARTGNMDQATLTDCAKIFCNSIRQAGYEAMIYFNPTLGETMLELEELVEYPFWLAMYSDQMTYPYAVEMWQYTSKGQVPGITVDTDINIWFKD